MGDVPTLYICDGDEGGPRIHPCRRVQEALHDGIPYEKVIAAKGSPFPFLRKGPRADLERPKRMTKTRRAPATLMAPPVIVWPARIDGPRPFRAHRPAG
jgi:hypothetical protein